KAPATASVANSLPNPDRYERPDATDSVSKSTALDSLLCFMHRLVDLIETVHCKQHFLELIHFYRGVEHFVQGEIVHGAMSFDHAQAFAVRADESAAVDLDFVVLADETELDGIPE